MKPHEICEMAIKGGNFRPIADKYASEYSKFFNEHPDMFKHIGDIEMFRVMKYDEKIFLFDEDRMIFICSVLFFPYEDDARVVDSIWLDSSYEGKRIFSKVLWFLRAHEGIKKLVLGDHHSKDTYNLLKAGGLSKFSKVWFNSNTQKKEKFSTDNIDDFYSGHSSEWKLILESNSNGDMVIEEMKGYRFSFITDLSLGFTRASYDWQIE